ncbi:MAG: hypothetical protein IJ297_04510, partial [Clostridia bacterium]|nr:hypothetical protein [Clostridia bacterium]
MQAVINISSEGTRLRPLSCTKCVGMIDICDCEIVKRLIYHLKEQGVDDVIVITDYMSEDVEEYLKNKTSKVSFIKAAAVNAIGSSLEESFIYISKSIYTDFNLSEAMSFHLRKKSVATVVASKGISGGIISDKYGKVLRIEERRMWNSLFAKQGTGIYILNRECVKYIGAEGDDISRQVLPALVREGKAVYTIALAGVCEAVDDFASYMRACFIHLDLLKKSKEKGIAVMDGAVVDKGALLESPCY